MHFLFINIEVKISTKNLFKMDIQYSSCEDYIIINLSFPNEKKYVYI